jgi:hypothetical protein
MADVGFRHLRRSLFKKLYPLVLPCQYIFSLMIYIVEHLEIFQTNSWINDLDTRNTTQLHRAVTNFSCFQKVVSYAGIEIFNSLPSSILNPRNDK